MSPKTSGNKVPSMPISFRARAVGRDLAYFLNLREFRKHYWGREGARAEYSSTIGSWVLPLENPLEEIEDEDFPTLRDLVYRGARKIRKPKVGRAYLNRLNTNGVSKDEFYSPRREFRYFLQRRRNGFDDRELWALDLSAIELIYERLARLKEVTHIDFYYHKDFSYQGEAFSQGELIDRLLEIGESIVRSVQSDNFWELEEVYTSKQKEFWEIWAIIAPYTSD